MLVCRQLIHQHHQVQRLHYAKTIDGLQHAISAQLLIPNWLRPHWSLGKQTTPAMGMGLCDRPIPMEEFLSLQG